ncbi:MAG: hypothetical protein KC419_26000, partial [Anaerolineales bacterium]|nr:hypothetical protein [Anaerolineales bacterium]
HAHSHLMYFGWVTLAAMGLMAAWLPELTGRPFSPHRSRLFKWSLILILLLSLAAYVPFLLFGYRSAVVGTVQLPLSTIAAGLNMVAWYWFGWLYWQETKGVARIRPLRLWDAALIFMLAATIGAWGVAVSAAAGLQDPTLSSVFTHLFLDLFAEGWFVLALLGAIHAGLPSLRNHKWLRHSEDGLIMGMPVIFLLGVPVHLLPLPVRLLGGIGGAFVAVGLWVQAVVLWQSLEKQWKVPLIFLALKATVNLLVAVPAVAVWAERAGLRISYLHWLLLGFVTLGLVVAAAQVWGRRWVPSVGWLTAVVLLLLVSLVPLTAVWPGQWHGLWTRQFAAWMSVGPVLVVSVFLGRRYFQKLRQKLNPSKPERESSNKRSSVA